MAIHHQLEDKILSTFLTSLGPWRDYVIIGGGFALFIYSLYLTDEKLNIHPIGTRDIDSLIPRKVPQISEKNLAQHLKEAGFQPLFKDIHIPATESYVKEIEGAEIEIEFLTDNLTRVDKTKNVQIAGIIAQPLSYLDLSLKNSCQFYTYSNEKGFVVAPSIWVFHKGLTFVKRTNPLKKLKDLYGIWFVMTQLGSLSHETADHFLQLKRQYPQWFLTFQKNLKQWLDNVSPNEWSMLEMQDPSGRLKKLSLEKVIKQMILP